MILNSLTKLHQQKAEVNFILRVTIPGNIYAQEDRVVVGYKKALRRGHAIIIL